MPTDGDIMEDPLIENTLVVQRKRCTDEMYRSFPDPCLSCVLVAKHIDMSSCRFRNIRAFKRQPGTEQLIYGPYFTTSKRRCFHLKMPSTMTLPAMTKEQQLYIQECIRPVMKELLERDWKVMKLNEQTLQLRPPSNSRHTCDHCYTNIFNVHYMCTICGVDVCLGCFELDSEWTIDNVDSDNNDKDIPENGLKYSLTSCTLGRRHTKSHFIPITKHDLSTIGQLRLYTSLHIPRSRTCPPLLLDLNSSPTSTSTTSSVLSVTSLLSAETAEPNIKAPPSPFFQPPTQQLPSTPSSLSPTSELHAPDLCDYSDCNHLLVASWKQLTVDEFQRYWQSGKPAIIQHTMERSKRQWSPDYFSTNFGNQLIDAIDCRTAKVKQMTIKDFFKRYKDTDYQWPVLKIKDWPPGANFESQCPMLYKDFMAMLPMPDYCSATGVYNLSSRLPDSYIKPDLGPKMFIAYGLDPTCQVGTTNLHCDMTDAVNVMCHAQQTPVYDNNTNNKTWDVGISSTPGKAAAIWDIFSYDDLPRLRHFVGQLLKENEAQASPSEAKRLSTLDPIHGQWIYLTDQHLKRLKETYNIEPWRIYQNPGDAVFIPAGCAHQVVNRCNAIKCAYDFVSPENIERSAAITQQLGQAKQEDVLQLKTTLLYTWISVYKAFQSQSEGDETKTKGKKRKRNSKTSQNHKRRRSKDGKPKRPERHGHIPIDES